MIPNQTFTVKDAALGVPPDDCSGMPRAASFLIHISIIAEKYPDCKKNNWTLLPRVFSIPPGHDGLWVLLQPLESMFIINICSPHFIKKAAAD